jgi:hypothetical protein
MSGELEADETLTGSLDYDYAVQAPRSLTMVN